MAKITAKDCSPFDSLSSTSEKCLEALCKSFEEQNYGSDEYEPIAMKRYNIETHTFQWWASRYIGLAYIGSTEISITPRFGTKILLAILEDVYNIKTTEHDAKNDFSPDWFSSLLNILQTKMWVERCAQANRYGLPHTNIKKGYQGVSLNGALDIPKSIIPWVTRKEIYTNVYEKTLDDTICRIVYQAYRILSRKIEKKKKGKKGDTTAIGFGVSLPSTIQDTINTLNSQYKGTIFDLTESDYQRIQYKSIYLSWKPLVDFSWSVIRNRQMGYSAANKTTDCVFVDMAEIWEAFLRKKLAERFADWRVLSVGECTYETYDGTFFKRNIIPDIILEKKKDDGSKEYMVFDAKYKRMTGTYRQVKYSDVDRSDFFQIHTYIQYIERSLGKVVLGGLLYPLSEDIGEESPSSFFSNNLFGIEDSRISDSTKFVVDGVYCPETETDINIKDQVDAMISRLQHLLDTN